MRRVIGIDCGLQGGLALLDVNATGVVRVELARTPTTLVRRGRQQKREYDAAAMLALLTRWHPPGVAPIVGLELQGARPGQGVVSMFRAGVGFGLWWGLVVGLELAHHVVPPGVWRRHHGLTGCDKRASRLKAQALFPQLGALAPADEGPSEAALLAAYLAAIRTEGVSHEPPSPRQ